MTRERALSKTQKSPVYAKETYLLRTEMKRRTSSCDKHAAKCAWNVLFLSMMGSPWCTSASCGCISVKSDLHSIKRALYSIKRAL